MALTRTWIDSKLSRRERARLVEYLLERWSNPTAEQILSAIEELFPEKEPPGIRSVSDWKAKAWEFEVGLTEMRAEGEAARRVVEDGNDFGAANKKKLDELLWRKLRELKDGDEIDGKLHDLVLSSARLTAQVRANRESEGKLKLLEAKLAELAREKAEWECKEKEREEAKKKAIADIRNGGGLSDEALAKLEAQIGSL